MLKCTQLCINYLKPQSTFLSNQTNVLIQQSRNTFILKRKYVPPLYKKCETRAKLKHKHFIYEVVENTNNRKQKEIDVILLNAVKDVGEMGQKITLPSVKAYEKFILPKLAVYATPENIEKYLIQDIEDRKRLCAYSSQFVERTICVLSQCYLRLRMSLDVPWTIEKWHLRVCFRMQGLIVPENAIILPEKAISGPDISIENREFYVTVKINDHEEVKVRCKIHQYTSDPEREIIYDTPYYQFASRAIFPEDQEILNSLPRHRLANKEIRDETEENTEDLE